MEQTCFLGTQFPLIQSPMAGSQSLSMALAVSSAGAMGSLPTATLSHDELVSLLQEWQALGKPALNVNFFAHAMPELDSHKALNWQAILEPFAQEYGADFENIDLLTARRPFDDQHLDIIRHFKPPLLSFHFGLPSPEHIQAIKALGIKIMSSATTVAEAIWLDANGADFIIAQGLEAGGHRGLFLHPDISTQVGTFALLPKIVAAVNKPVIAAGGIANTQGIQAALTLGASAVQMGTVFLACEESSVTAEHRQALLSDPSQQHTAITNIYTGRPARGIVNPIMTKLQYIHPQALDFPYAAPFMSRIASLAKQQGNVNFTPMWCGQNTSGCQNIGAEKLTKQLCQVFNHK